MQQLSVGHAELVDLADSKRREYASVSEPPVTSSVNHAMRWEPQTLHIQTIHRPTSLVSAARFACRWRRGYRRCRVFYPYPSIHVTGQANQAAGWMVPVISVRREPHVQVERLWCSNSAGPNVLYQSVDNSAGGRL